LIGYSFCCKKKIPKKRQKMLLARALPRALLARAPVNVVYKRAFGAVAPG